MKTTYKTDRSASIKNQTAKNIRCLALWMLAVMTFSCNDKLEIDIIPEENFLELESTTISFAATETDTKTVEVDTDAAEWDFTVESPTEWLTVEQQDNLLCFTPNGPNTGTTLRSAEVTVTAGNAEPATVLVTQAGIEMVVYNTIKCDYLGNLSNNGNAQFYFNMYHSDDDRIGIRIEGFCTLPTSFNEFKLDVGNYTLATTGAVRTIFPGRVEETVIISSCHYDVSVGSWILVRGGSMSVALDGNIYTITTNLSGINIYTNEPANVPPSIFIGEIEFSDKTQATQNQLSVNPASIVFEANETATQTATVTTNASAWDFSVPSAASSWLTVEKQGNTLSFTPTGLNKGASELSTTVTVTAGNAIPVNVTVTQKITMEDEPPITYDTAECEYWGNIYNSGTANFDLWLFNSSDPDVGIRIEGFNTLPSNFSNFRLEAGTYTMANSGIVRTFFPGSVEGASIYPTYLFDRNNSNWTLVTGGAFTVSVAGSTYTVTTNFTGEDVHSGAVVNDIRIAFTGTIKYIDKTESEPDPTIVKSTYTATATPKMATVPGASTWSGTIEPKENSTEKWYEVTNWGNLDIKIFLDENDGKIVIDDYTKLGESATHDAYFRVAFIEDDNLILFGEDDNYTYDLIYDPSAKILTFPNKVIFDNKEFAAVIGVAGYNKITGKPEVLFSDFYADVTFQLTPVQPASASLRKSNNTNINTNINSKTLKDLKKIDGAKFKPINSSQKIQKFKPTIKK